MDYNRRTVESGYDDTKQDETTTKPRGRGYGCWIILLLLLLGGGGVTAILMGTIVTREETPLPGEQLIADLGVRYLAIPGEYADMRLPSRPSIDVNRGRTLYQANCIVCHGSKGVPTAEESPWGVNMYPIAANLTEQRVKSKSDGQLFYILAHGINLSGMPAWGKAFAKGPAYEDDDLWSLVKYMRQDFHHETQ